MFKGLRQYLKSEILRAEIIPIEPRTGNAV